MKCPKEPKTPLTDGILAPDLAAKCCPDCGGAWIPPENYLIWQNQQGIDREQEPQVDVLPSTAEISFQVSPLDNRAALCPDCGHYLVRGRIVLKESMFFVERCPNCKGYWCDRGEWEILQQLKLDIHLENIFSDLWQSRVKELEASWRERQATVDKLGPDIAAKLFELADLLEKHPNGDFGVAYLMRRFEE
ncbi:MAG: zf-TFIIB domain-containing protein [Cyanobacteria bacterium P01_F01_bin.86]